MRKSEVGGQRSEVGSQRSEVRGQKSEDEDQSSEVRRNKGEGSESVTIWGTGTPRREFLYVDDMADACLFVMKHYNEDEMINIGVGKDISITELARLIKDVVAFEGPIHHDLSKPDGTPQKLLDVSRLESMGWRSKTSLREGIEKTYRWYVEEGARTDRR